MSRDVKSIDIQFENCEIANIPKEYLENFYATNIHTSIGMCVNAVTRLNVADKIHIEIDKEYADTHNAGFGVPLQWDVSITERLLRQNDITNVYIYYDDDTEETITAPWFDDDDYSNLAQVVTINVNDMRKIPQEYICVDIERKGEK